MCLYTSDRSTRAGEACTNDKEPVNRPQLGHVLALMSMWP